ncbi:DNA-binding response regulator, partial [Staphylococcus aureus]|nr:DNA-binding response regulator [Staphylococcus aureus]
MQVLLVEDDQTLFQELKKELEHWDFFVTGIDDFSAVMDIYEETNPE